MKLNQEISEAMMKKFKKKPYIKKLNHTTYEVWKNIRDEKVSEIVYQNVYDISNDVTDLMHNPIRKMIESYL